MDEVLAWLDAHQVFAVAITTVVGLIVTALFKETRRLWTRVLHQAHRGLRWVGSYRVVHKSKVRPRTPPFVKPVRWAATLGPKVGEAVLRNKASGVAKNVQLDDGYNLKVIGDAQWAEFLSEERFECVLDLTHRFFSVQVSWFDELDEPHTQEVEVTTIAKSRNTFAT